jgi:hypothetical protein
MKGGPYHHGIEQKSNRKTQKIVDLKQNLKVESFMYLPKSDVLRHTHSSSFITQESYLISRQDVSFVRRLDSPE